MRRIALVLILVAIWLIGLMAFAGRIERSTPAAEPPVSDAVVALTGASTARLTSAVRLLEEGRGQRLLVSGVNREVTRADLLEVTGAWKPIYQCCVDLGFEAVDTIGNAEEIAAWSKKHGFDQIIVVTADYHMPRSMLEIRSKMPGAKLIPYPVKTDALDAGRWWQSAGEAKRLVIEYSKYLAILARESVMGLFRKAPEAAPKKGQS